MVKIKKLFIVGIISLMLIFFAQSVFAQTVTETWTGSNGSPWPSQWNFEGALNKVSSIDIQNNEGRLAAKYPASGSVVAYINNTPAVNTDQGITFRINDNTMAFGMVSRRSDANPNTFYYTHIAYGSSSNTLYIIKSVNSVSTTLGSTPANGFTINKNFQMRFITTTINSTHTQLVAKVWPTGTNESGAWVVSLADKESSLQGIAGRFGLRYGLFNGRKVYTDNYIVNADVPADSFPIASASANPTSGTAPLTVDFTGSVTGGDAPLTYFWDFKDGFSSTQQNPQHIFNTAGTYNVSFTATDFDGDSSASNVLINVNNKFDFSLSTNPSSGVVVQTGSKGTVVTATLLNGTSQNIILTSSGCPPSSTCAFSTSSGFPTFTSNFNVATSSSTPVGSYVIALNGTGGGLTRTATFTLDVTDSQPAASASANTLSGYVPLTVYFFGSVTGGDAPISYLWNFSDGTTSTSQNPQYMFNTAGTYNVTFKATDNDGDTSTSSVLVTVGDFSVLSNPSSASVAQGGNTTTDVTVSLLSGTSYPVNLSLTGCPASSTCSFSQTTGNPTYTATLTVSTSSLTPVGIYPINITGAVSTFVSDNNLRSTTYTLAVNPIPQTGNLSLSSTPNGAAI